MIGIAALLARFWDWIDQRDVDKHLMAWAIMYLTIKMSLWTVDFVGATTRAGTDVAAIIAAIWLPWSGVQAVVIKWYFDAR